MNYPLLDDEAVNNLRKFVNIQHENYLKNKMNTEVKTNKIKLVKFQREKDVDEIL